MMDVIISRWGERYEIDDTIAKHKSVDYKLTDAHVVTIAGTAEGGYYMAEQCDENFYCDLTKEDCMEMSALFGDMARRLE